MQSMTQDSTSTKRNLIILDFDGVINASKYAYAVKTDNHWNGVYDVETLYIDEKPFTIYYSPELVSVINSWGQRDDTDIIWVTTWATNTKQFTKLGFNKFEEATPEYDDDIPYGHLWKPRIGASLIENSNYEKYVWVDDDETINGPYKKWPSQVQDKFLRVNPMPDFGLTKEDVKTIESYLEFEEPDS